MVHETTPSCFVDTAQNGPFRVAMQLTNLQGRVPIPAADLMPLALVPRERFELRPSSPKTAKELQGARQLVTEDASTVSGLLISIAYLDKHCSSQQHEADEAITSSGSESRYSSKLRSTSRARLVA